MIRMVPPNFSWLLDQKHVSWFLANVFFRHLFVSKVSKGHPFFHSKTLKKPWPLSEGPRYPNPILGRFFAMTWPSGLQASDIGGRMIRICWWCRFWTPKKTQNAWSLRFAFGTPPCPTWRPSFFECLVFFSKIPSSQCLTYVITNWNSSWVTLIKIDQDENLHLNNNLHFIKVRHKKKQKKLSPPNAGRHPKRCWPQPGATHFPIGS